MTEPYQERVLAKRAELDDKLGKLLAFLGNDAAPPVSDDERNRLRRQAQVMREYSDILGQRIQAWGVGRG